MDLVKPLGQRGSFVRGKKFNLTPSLKKCHICFFFNVARLNRMVSLLLVELPRTLKSQNEIEFDFQSI